MTHKAHSVWFNPNRDERSLESDEIEVTPTLEQWRKMQQGEGVLPPEVVVRDDESDS